VNAHNWFHPNQKARDFIPAMDQGTEDYRQALKDWTELQRELTKNRKLSQADQAILDALDARLTAWEDRHVTQAELDRHLQDLSDRRRSPR